MTTTEPSTGFWPDAELPEPEPRKGRAKTSKNKPEKDPVDEVRAAQAQKWEIRVAKAEAKAAGKRRLADTKLDIADSDERVDLRRAMRKRRKMTDSGAHLASMYRKYRAVRIVLAIGALVGMVWASFNVANGLDGPSPKPIFYAVEGIFSLPVVCIAFMQTVASECGRLSQLRPFRKRPGGWMYWPTLTGLIEMGLLSLTVLIASWPSLSAPVFSFERLVTSAFAPVMVVVFVLLQLVAAELFGPIIREAWLSGDDSDVNMRERVRRANNLVIQVQAAMADKDNPMPVGDDGLPSISSIQRRFPSEKLTAQCAHDALALFRKGVR